MLHCLHGVYGGNGMLDAFFEGYERSVLEIKSLFFLTLLEWSLVLPSCFCFSLPVLINHCNPGS